MTHVLSTDETPQWRIELCERPVHLGSTVDHLLFGKNLLHPFLAMIDQDNTVRGEIHGIPYDNSQLSRQGRLNKIFEYSTILTTPFYADKPFLFLIEHSPLKKHFPTLRSVFFESARQYARADQRTLIAANDGEAINETWQILESSAERLNDLNLTYNRYGERKGCFNCQATIATILNEAGFHSVRPSGKFAAPGWKLI